MSKTPGSSDQHSLIASQIATSALFGANAPYLEDLYERYLAGEAVEPQWQAYFDGLRADSAERAHGPIIRELEQRAQSPRRAVAAAVATGADSNSEKQAAVSRLVQIYTNRGHLIAKLDPLGLMQRPMPRVLQLDYAGLSASDLDSEFFTGSRTEAIPRRATLRQIIDLMQKVYCGPIGAEFAHVSDTEERLWLQDEFQRLRLQSGLSADERDRKSVV